MLQPGSQIGRYEIQRRLGRGGRINGAMLRAGLVDEVSLLVAPVADGRIGTPALFDVDGEDADEVRPWSLDLEVVEQRADGMLWLRYRVEATGQSKSR